VSNALQPRWESALQSARERERLHQQEQVVQAELQRQLTRLTGAWDAVLNHREPPNRRTPGLLCLAEGRMVVGMPADEAGRATLRECFHARWPDLFLELGAALDAAGLRESLAELEEASDQAQPTPNCRGFTAEVLRLACEGNRAELDRALRQAREVGPDFFNEFRHCLLAFAPRSIGMIRERLTQQSEPRGTAPPATCEPTEATSGIRPLSPIRQQHQAQDGTALPPDQQGKVDEIRRAAETLRSVICRWELWPSTHGEEVLALPDEDKPFVTPPEMIAAIGAAAHFKYSTRMAVQTLYEHGYLTPSLRGRALDEALRLFPSPPEGPISITAEKGLVGVVREAMPALRQLDGELAHLTDQLGFTPLSVLASGEAEGAGAGRTSGQGGAGQTEGASGSDERTAPILEGGDAAGEGDAGPTDRQCLILETMSEQEITSKRRRKTRAEVVRLINRTHKPQTYNRAFAALVKSGHLRSLVGHAGGVWLTPEGTAESNRLRSPPPPSTMP
jgi:hypothetical protein